MFRIFKTKYIDFESNFWPDFRKVSALGKMQEPILNKYLLSLPGVNTTDNNKGDDKDFKQYITIITK